MKTLARCLRGRVREPSRAGGLDLALAADQTPDDGGVAVVAIPGSVRVDPVEPGAEVLPARGGENAPIQVHDGRGDAGELENAVQKHLEMG